MSADVLREAAALMRELANCTSGGAKSDPWRFLEDGDGDEITSGCVRTSVDNHSWTVAETDYANDAEFIASWHPAVALAVADWLNACALVTEVAPDRHKGLALAVARAYLGSES